jgi:hypothetical protein
MRIRVVPDYIDKSLLNFSRPLIDELVLESNTNGKFPIQFFRNGTGEKRLNMTLRFVAEPNETIPHGMISLKPATDIKIALIQKSITDNKGNNNIYIYLIAVVVVVVLVVLAIFYRKKKQ